MAKTKELLPMLAWSAASAAIDPEQVVVTATGEALQASKFTDCDDINPDCPLWARSGECDANPGFMIVECAISATRA